ncbi:MAG: hypothetical protein U0271_01770 [Polyangiaceae bacterium]
MRVPSRVAALVGSALFALFVGRAQAAETTLVGELQAPPDRVLMCSHFRATVMRWTPAEGPPATFIADTYMRLGGNTFIGLGYDATGYWSAEATRGSDPCDDCSFLSIVHTGFDGKREFYPVGQGVDFDPQQSPAERRKSIKQKIFTLAAGPLDFKSLRHDYRLTLPKHDADGQIARFTGWFVEVETKDKPLLRFGVWAESFMCWCEDGWVGYTLKGP